MSRVCSLQSFPLYRYDVALTPSPFSISLGQGPLELRRTMVTVKSIGMAFFVGVVWISLSATAQTSSKQDTVLIVPHTHWEGAVFKTREEYLEEGLPNILKALYLLKKYPNYRFVLDQMCYVRPFIERYPTEVATFREMLSQGRLQIAGGTDTMHDNNIPSGESIAHQYLLGKSWFREHLGYDVTSGWGLDTFGHNAQMPQILKLAGMKSYWFQRGVTAPDTPSEFLWRGIDGTEIPAFWLPISYAALVNVPANEADFDQLIRGRFDSLNPFAHGKDRVLLAGADVWEPEETLPIMVDKFNSGPQPVKAKIALPSDFEQLAAARERPVIGGELNPVFQGIYSSRIDVKQAMRRSEPLLTTAEKLSVIAGVLGHPPMERDVEEAWEPLLFNEAHDLTSGVMVDKVYEDSLQRYDQVRKTTDKMIRENLAFINSRINTAGQGVPITVFNTLGWERNDIAEVDVPFSDAGVQQFSLFDSNNRAIAFQILKVIRNDYGGIRQAHIAFVAQNIPALGYAVFHAVPNATGPNGSVAVHNTTREDSGTLENEFYRASFNMWNGDMNSLVLKDGNWESLSAPGNVVAREYDGGDFWELYGTLNGGRFTSMKKPILAPRPRYTQRSSDFVGGSGSIQDGPVFSEFRITHPLGKNQFRTSVRMYKGLRRIDIATELTNQEEFVRYRALFPSTIRNGKAVHEIPFGAVERPNRQEFPAQNWIDYSDGAHGLTLINEGLPGNNVDDGQLMLSLMRSSKLISYGFIGGYEPGVGSDTGLGIGKTYKLNYAIVPHAGDWRNSLPWRDGLEFNNPLITQTVASHPGELPSRWGLLKLSNGAVVVSTLKPSKEGTSVLRVYEASGRDQPDVQAIINSGVGPVEEVNLVEDSIKKTAASSSGFHFSLRAYEIKTYRLHLSGQNVASTNNK
jgi:alpha-mannosidase